jgi:hypothetical protein
MASKPEAQVPTLFLFLSVAQATHRPIETPTAAALILFGPNNKSDLGFGFSISLLFSSPLFFFFFF